MKNKRERKLSKKELQRKEEFDKLTKELIEKGYTPNHLILGLFESHIFSLLMTFPLIIMFYVLYRLSYKMSLLSSNEFILFLCICFVLIMMHELIHGIVWALGTPTKFKSISFGFIVKTLTPYCTCNVPLSKSFMIWGALMPTILLGIIPCFISLLNGSLFLLCVGMFMILGGGGDMLVVWNLLKYKSKGKEVLFIDHPYELGTAIFEKGK